MTPLARRRWRNFRANRRAFISLIVFGVLFALSLMAELLANERPLLVSYRGELRAPFLTFYSEADFGGDFATQAAYQEPEVTCLIRSGGMADACFDAPHETLAAIEAGTFQEPGWQQGWLIRAPIPYGHASIVNRPGAAPSPPDWHNLLGTDSAKRDVLARVIYGFRISILFALLVTALSSALGIAAGAVQGYFGGTVDLLFQRLIEIWSGVPALYVIIIVFAIFERSFAMLVALSVLFGWPALVGVVRAEFLRARGFEYVRAAKALGVRDRVIIWRHVLPNAMVATLTLLPFLVTGTIGGLATLDYLGYGLPSSAPSLGELTRQAKENLQAPWLGFTAFASFAVMLSLLVFIFEGLRDAFDPRKTFV